VALLSPTRESLFLGLSEMRNQKEGFGPKNLNEPDSWDRNKISTYTKMRFPNLSSAWKHFRRAKKQVTVAKNNAKVAAAEYREAKNNANVAPSRKSYGVMREVQIKNGNYVHNVGVNNNGYNNLKRTHAYNRSKGYWVRKN